MVPSEFVPSKVLAEVKRSIASQKHAYIPSRVYIPDSLQNHDDKHRTSTSIRYKSWMEYATKLRVETPDILYVSVPAMIKNTKYTAADIWKDARRGTLKVHISPTHATVTADTENHSKHNAKNQPENSHWVHVTTYLDNVKQQCQQLQCTVFLTNNEPIHILFDYNATPQLTINDICERVEHAMGGSAYCGNVATWSFALHDSYTDELINSATKMQEPQERMRWWASHRFGAASNNFSVVRHLTAHPIAQELLNNDTILQSIGLYGNRKQYAKDIQRTRDRELRQEQDAAYYQSLEVDQRQKQSQQITAVPTTSPTTIENEQPQEETSCLLSQDNELSVRHELTRDELRAARRHYFESRFAHPISN